MNKGCENVPREEPHVRGFLSSLKRAVGENFGGFNTLKLHSISPVALRGNHTSLQEKAVSTGPGTLLCTVA